MFTTYDNIELNRKPKRISGVENNKKKKKTRIKNVTIFRQLFLIAVYVIVLSVLKNNILVRYESNRSHRMYVTRVDSFIFYTYKFTRKSNEIRGNTNLGHRQTV